MKSDDYVKFLTEQFVRYMNQPKSERKRRREAKRKSRTAFRNEMFGLLPNALGHYANRIKRARLRLPWRPKLFR
nr:YqzE family protein [Caenibacillus caldisaponilyticus]